MFLGRSCVLVGITIVMWVTAVEEARAEGMTAKETVQSIVASHKKIKEEFHPTRYVDSFVEWVSPGSEKMARVTEYLRHGDNILVKTESNGESQIWGANDDYQFRIERRTPMSDWCISDASGRSNDPLRSATASTLALGKHAFIKGLVANHVPIAELLTHPQSEIVSCSEIQEGEDRLVRIEVKVKDPTAMLESGLSIRFAKVTFFFAPEKSGWIPTKVDLRGQMNDGLTCLNSQFTEVGGQLVPLEMKSIARRSNGTEWERTNGSSEYGFDEISNDVFYLTHYGLPEPNGSPPVTIYLRLWISVLSIILIVVAICLFSLRHRRVAARTE